LAGLVYYSGLNFARDVGTFYSLLFWEVCSGVVWSFEGKLKNLKDCSILFLFFVILRNQQTAGCSSLTELIHNQRIAGPGLFQQILKNL
jgi:hypothetical protein